MDEQLTTRAERAVADLEAVSAFLKGPWFESRMAEAVRAAVIECQSPWVDRAGAAARWRCSESEIDRAARAGVLVRLERGETPLFEKEQGDRAIREGTWKIANFQTPKANLAAA